MTPHKNRIDIIIAVAIITFPMAAYPALTAEDFFPPQPDPFVGDYEGRWGSEETVVPEIAAQVIALGNDTYRIRLVNKLEMRCPIIFEGEVKTKGGKLAFKQDNFYGETEGTTFTGGRIRGKSAFSMKRIHRRSPTFGRKPPQGAVTLFDGANLDAWKNTKYWEVLDDGTLMVTPKGGYLVSKESWTDVTLHVEFRTSSMPRSRGQQRSNSGVFLQDTYEVQILDSHGLDGYYNECGALYKLSAPHVNMCYPPLVWQTYDITYTAPTFEDSGELLKFGRMTVYHNGVLIHNDQELKWITAWKEEERDAPPPKRPGPIKLQGHNNYIQFRNIWLIDNAD